ncbi:MAG: hypothetical protein C4554_05295 [Dethiobacter sp.]|nr:MAG: hypothetical protein C4554_05295 [Dethiobacter sp.]
MAHSNVPNIETHTSTKHAMLTHLLQWIKKVLTKSSDWLYNIGEKSSKVLRSKQCFLKKLDM